VDALVIEMEKEAIKLVQSFDRLGAAQAAAATRAEP
jgi:hypothetical protein